MNEQKKEIKNDEAEKQQAEKEEVASARDTAMNATQSVSETAPETLSDHRH